MTTKTTETSPVIAARAAGTQPSPQEHRTMTTKTTATSVIAARATGNKRAALYLRVSTDGQTTENQRLELAAVAERSGWHVVEVYEDHAISGAKGRDQRPAFDRLCKAATRREFDVVIPRRTPCPPLLP